MGMPTVLSAMTAFPWSVEGSLTVGEARSTMRAQRLRHLPVLEDGALVGIVTDRTLRGVDPARPVGEVAVRDPFVVRTSAPLDGVVATMAERRLGSALVVREDGTLVGIVTTTDVCRLYSELLRSTWGRRDPSRIA
jgi:acetoin utilization protein AcuB